MLAKLAGETDVKAWREAQFAAKSVTASPGSPNKVNTADSSGLDRLSNFNNSLNDSVHNSVSNSFNFGTQSDLVYPQPPETPRSPDAPRPKIMGLSADLSQRYDSLNLSLSQMNKIFFVDNNTRLMTAESPRKDTYKSKSGYQINAHQPDPASLHTQWKSRPKQPTTPLYTELNEMIHDGLSLINADDVEDEIGMFSRLDVYRNTFDKFISEFHMYQPFLASVKFEYDCVVDHLRQKLRSGFSFRTEIATLEQKHAGVLRNITSDFEAKISKLNSEKAELEKLLKQRDKRVAEQTTDIARMRESTAKAMKEVDDNRQSCIILTSGLNRLEEERKKHVIVEGNMRQELVELKLSEVKHKDETERLRSIIQDLESQQQSLVSQDIVDTLKDKINKMEGDFKTLDSSHKQLIERYMTIKGAIEKAHEKSFLKGQSKKKNPNDSTQSKGNAAKLHVHGSDVNDLVAKVKAVIEEGESPRALIEIMANQIEELRRQLKDGFLDSGGSWAIGGLRGMGGDNGSESNKPPDDGDSWGTEDPYAFHSPWNHFVGQGFEDTVPSYLRTTGRVQSLFMTRREAVVLIHELFAQPDVIAAAGVDAKSLSLEPPSIAKLFENFLEAKFGDKFKAIEVAYNLIDAAQRYSTCSDCRIFSYILNGDLPIAAWADMLALVETIQANVYQEMMVSSKFANAEKNKVAYDSVMKILKKLLPTKSDASMKRLQKAVQLECKGSRTVDPKSLLSEGVYGDRSRVLELIRFQHVTESADYHKKVFDQLLKLKSERAALAAMAASSVALNSTASGSGAGSVLDVVTEASDQYQITLMDIREIFVETDSNKSRSDVNKIIASACDVTVEDALLMEAKKEPITIDDVIKRLRRKVLKKSPPEKKSV